MAFADKKGIVVASPFKLQAESLLDVRQQVDTITERNELVTIKAATAGLRVYVKETKKSYVYNGTSWDELSVGNASLIVKLNGGTSEGTNMFTYNGTTNKTINITAAGIGAAGKTHTHTKSEITDFPTSLKNPQALKFTGAATASYDGSAAVTVTIPTTSKTTKSLIVTLNGGTTEGTNKFTFDGSAEKTINITPSTIGAAAATHTHDKSQITGLTTGRVLISDANGHPAVSAVTSTELGYIDGVTSNIQTQLNGKAASTHTHNYAGSSSAGGSANSAVKLATARKINGTSFDGTKDINIQNNYFESVSEQNLNSFRTYGEYYGAGGNDCTNRPSGVDSFYLKIFRNASGYTAQSLYSVGVWYSRYYDGSSWSTWSKQYSSTSKPTASEIGAASSSHTHTKSQITDFPTSLKNPNALTFAGAVTGTYDGSKAVTINIPTTGATTKSSLTIQLNGGTTEGTNKFTFNGGTAKTINITPASIGAAAASHGTHVTYGTSAPKANGTASAGSATSVSRSDHVHPLQTTVSGNAGSATKLATARSIRTNLASTTAASFNGTADITPGITGTLPISHGGTGATSARGAEYNIMNQIRDVSSAVADSDYFVGISQNPSASNGACYKRTGSNVWSWINGKVSASYAAKSHTHNYLPLSGGTVTGNVILQKGSYVHHATGTGGASGYVNIATIKIRSTYQNVPIAFEVYRRGTTQPTMLYVTFASANNTDPGLTKLSFEGAGVSDDFAIVKTTTSTWNLYIRKTEAYDDIAIAEYHTNFSYMSNTTVTWTNVHAASLPSGATKATKITEASSTPNSLTIQFNGTTKATFNGSAAATVNITPSSIGAAASSHTHNYAGSSSAGGAANSVKAALTLQLNGSTKATFNGSTAATVNITASSIGAAASNHTHSYLPLSGGTVTGDIGLPSGRANKDGSTPFAGSTINNLSSITKLANYKTVLGSYTDSNGKWYDIISVRHRNGNGDGSSYGMYLKSDLTASGNLSWGKQYGSSSWQAERTLIDSSNYGSWCAAKSHTHNYAGSSSAGGAANSANRLNGISLTGGSSSGAITGYRLIATVKIPAWGNYRGVFAVNSRHTGAGLLCISVGCNNSSVSFANGYSEIMYFGPVSSGSIISSDSFLVHMSSDGTKAYIFWKFSDHNTTTIVTLDSDFAISNGTWMTSISTSTYGNRKATTTINPSSAHNHSASNITSGTLPVARGGTGATTAIAANYNILKDTPAITSGWSDDTAIAFISASPNTTQGALRKYKAGNVWSQWLNGKISASYAAKSHTHNYAGSSSSGGAANSVKSALTIQFNGTTKATFNGSAAATVNITPSAIGAAAKSHTHNYAGSSSAGGAANSANKVPVPVGTVLFATSSTTTFFNACFGGTWEIVGNIDAIYGSSTLTLYMFRKKAA